MTSDCMFPINTHQRPALTNFPNNRVKAQDQKKPNTKTGEEVRDVYVELITNIHRRIF